MMKYSRQDFVSSGVVQPLSERDGVQGIYGLYGPWRCLSNFHMRPIIVDGLRFQCSEGAYMAEKTNDDEIKRAFCYLGGKDAKNLGRKVPLRSDWEDVKVECMTKVLRCKFEQDLTSLQILMNTGNLYIEETNWWNDNFWGVCDTEIGQNNLGLILMRIRKAINEVEEASRRDPKAS